MRFSGDEPKGLEEESRKKVDMELLESLERQYHAISLMKFRVEIRRRRRPVLVLRR